MKLVLSLLAILIFLSGVAAASFFWTNQMIPGQNNSSGQPVTPPAIPTASPTATPYKDLIVLHTPESEGSIASPLMVTGEARGNWFFEASFPVILTNWDGLIIAEGIATAQGDWMTEDFVPFTASLEFTKPEYGERGFLILQKANASGLPEHDDALEITVYFR